jgi:hypothetical protein
LCPIDFTAQVAQVSTYHQQVFGFCKRALCDIQESGVFLPAYCLRSFGNIRGDRKRCPSNLRN